MFKFIVSFWNCIIWNFLDVLRVSELITQACYYLKKYGQGFLPTLITCQLMIKHKSYPAWIYCMHTHLELWQMFNRQRLGVNFHTYNKLLRFFENIMLECILANCLDTFRTWISPYQIYLNRLQIVAWKQTFQLSTCC